jgi:hypothetical protein
VALLEGRRLKIEIGSLPRFAVSEVGFRGAARDGMDVILDGEINPCRFYCAERSGSEELGRL